ncbi:MAG: ATP-binding protein, partial [Methylococcaceae bacterium]
CKSRHKSHLEFNSTFIILILSSILDWLRLSGQSSFEGTYSVTYILTGIFLIFGILLIARLAATLITERNLSATLSLASRAAHAGFWNLDLLTHQVQWSQEMMALFGADTPRKDFDAWSTWQSRLHPEDRAAAVRDTVAAARDHTALELSYRIVLPNGTIHWIETRADIRENATGQATHLMGISLDVTQRRQAEEQLRESEARFRSLFEHLPIAYQSLDINGNWLDANDKMAELLGFDQAKDLLGLCFGDYCDEEQNNAFMDVFNQFKTNGAGHKDWCLRRRDGSHFLAHLVGYAQRDYEGRFIRTHCVLIDVTERRTLENEILAINASLEQRVEERTTQVNAANMAKSMFLANMSHEIRTPMNAIIGLTALVLDGELEASQRDYLDKVLAAAQALLGIINDILDFSKIDAGHLTIEHTPLELNEVVRNTMDLFRQKTEEKGLALVAELAPNLPTRLMGDALRLGQILTNLIGNAVKFTAQGEIHLKVEPASLETAHPPTVRLRFSVTDTGIGLSPKQVEQLFTPFSQADATITRQFGGTGLGLSICKRLVELMGGEISVTSHPAQGSCFTFTIQCGVAPPSTEPSTHASPTETATGKNGILARLPQKTALIVGAEVLLVEDNKVNQLVAKMLLQKMGLRVSLAENGVEAIDWVQQKHFDIVLMDVQMPVMDGLTATQRIRELPNGKEMPILAMTAGAMEQEKQACLEAGMNDHVSKPINVDVLLETLLKWIKPMSGHPEN